MDELDLLRDENFDATVVPLSGICLKQWIELQSR